MFHIVSYEEKFYVVLGSQTFCSCDELKNAKYICGVLNGYLTIFNQFLETIDMDISEGYRGND